jgi:hypothetical protein
MTISIEQEPPRTSRCDCCGGVSTRLTRFVYKDGDAYAAYCAVYADNHPDAAVSVVIGLGDWGEDSSREDRTAFTVQIRVSEEQFRVTVVDGEGSIWKSSSIFGRLLSRQEALDHPLLSEAFHLTDHIVYEDTEVHAYLERSSRRG